MSKHYKIVGQDNEIRYKYVFLRWNRFIAFLKKLKLNILSINSYITRITFVTLS